MPGCLRLRRLKKILIFLFVAWLFDDLNFFYFFLFLNVLNLLNGSLNWLLRVRFIFLTILTPFRFTFFVFIDAFEDVVHLLL